MHCFKTAKKLYVLLIGNGENMGMDYKQALKAIMCPESLVELREIHKKK